MRILIDTNVVLDVLQENEPAFTHGKDIFLAAANKRIEGFITAKEVADIHFFARKQFKGQDNVDEKARQVLAGLFVLFDIIDTLGSDCQNALGISNGDYEDAIMIAAAMRSKMDAIVTSDKRHFRKSPVLVYTPSEFVSRFLTSC